MQKAVVSFLLITLCVGVELVQITVEQGILEGETLTTLVDNTTYYSFKGIPYATPPIGNLRFKAPQPPVNWTGVRDATSHGASCPQIDLLTSIKNAGSENCLFLNVYTPDLDPTSPLPVLFFIHGGGFKSGSGNSSSFGPDFLVNQSVVLVTINYRLEALGFLTLGTEDVPGNAGLKDQVAALQWVKENIANFGGDPDNVTIFGQSAGAASVGLHMLSPMSKGLFQRAILYSGVPLCDFATSFKAIDRAFVLGKQLGIDTNDTSVLLNYLQNVSVDKLYDTSATLLTSEEIFTNVIKFFPFAPVIEKDFSNNNNFLPKRAQDILIKGTINDADVLIGYTNQETMTVVNYFNSTLMAVYDRYPEMFVPSKFFFKYKPCVNLKLAKMIRQHYFDNATIDVNVIGKFVNYTSESSFQYDIIRFLRFLPSGNNSRYLYKFSMSSDLNVYGNLGLNYGLTGAAGHLDDINYVFRNDLIDTSILTEGSTELALINNFSTLIANFAKYGNPTPDESLGVTWPEYDSTDESYLEIGNTLTVGTALDADMMTFWKSVFDYLHLPF